MIYSSEGGGHSLGAIGARTSVSGGLAGHAGPL